MPDSSDIKSSQLLEDWAWLTNDESAQQWLSGFSQSPVDSLSVTKRLRKLGLSPTRTRLIVEQLTLRPVAKKKFAQASQMFFDRTLLEQSTGEILAEYKAQRFSKQSGCNGVVDLCCGLGGDLRSFVKQVASIGVDASEVACQMARANCSSATIVNQTAEQFSIPAGAWVHVDPDRRVEGRRSTTLEFFSPDLAYLESLISKQKDVAIKLAPVTQLPLDWKVRQRQWLGDRHECKQQVVWLGAAAEPAVQSVEVPGKQLKTATAIDSSGSVMFEWHESEAGRSDVGSMFGEFLYEPHSTVIAGRMIDSIANRFQLRRIASDIQYLTGARVACPALTGYRILDSCRLDEHEVRERLVTFGAGSVEIKKRGVDHGLIDRFAKLKLEGSIPLTLVLTRLRERFVALICERLEPTHHQTKPVN